MECKKLIKADPKNSTTSAKKEATSSFSEALTAMGFFFSSDYNRFGSLIAVLSQDMIKGNNNYPRTVTIAYYMLAHI